MPALASSPSSLDISSQFDVLVEGAVKVLRKYFKKSWGSPGEFLGKYWESLENASILLRVYWNCSGFKGNKCQSSEGCRGCERKKANSGHCRTGLNKL